MRLGRVSRFVPYEQSTLVIRVLSYHGRCLKGFVTTPAQEWEIPFSNLMELLLTVEQLLDERQSPQQCMRPRIFDTPGHWQPQRTAVNTNRSTPLATFTLRILFRQNASWQGSVCWLERGAESPFRSVLELIGLLDSALWGLTEKSP